MATVRGLAGRCQAGVGRVSVWRQVGLKVGWKVEWWGSRRKPRGSGAGKDLQPCLAPQDTLKQFIKIGARE